MVLSIFWGKGCLYKYEQMNVSLLCGIIYLYERCMLNFCVLNNNVKLLCYEICLLIGLFNNIKLELVILYNVVMILRR